MTHRTKLTDDGRWVWELPCGSRHIGRSAVTFDTFGDAEQHWESITRAALAGQVRSVVTKTVSGGATFALVTRDGEPVLQGMPVRDRRAAQADANQALALLGRR